MALGTPRDSDRFFRTDPPPECQRAVPAGSAPVSLLVPLESTLSVLLSGFVRTRSNSRAAVAAPATRQAYPRLQSSAPIATRAASPFGLVIIAGIEIDSAERVQNLQLLAPANILIERGIHRLFLGLMAAGPAGFFDESIVQGEVRWHVYIITHYNV